LEERIAMGWECIAQAEYEEATEHFLAATRSAPLYREARRGLLESLKGRFWPHRTIRSIGLGALSAVSGHPRMSLGTLVLLTLVLPASLGKIGQRVPSLGRHLVLFGILLYLGFILIQTVAFAATIRTWFTEHRTLAFSAGDLASAVVGLVCMVAAAASLCAYPALDHYATIVAAFVLLLSGISQEAVLTMPVGRLRALLILAVVLLAAAGIACVVILFTMSSGQEIGEETPASSGVCFLVFFFGMCVCRFVAGFVSKRDHTGQVFFDPTTHASDPGGIRLSDAKLRRFHPELYGIRGLLDDLLSSGDDLSAADTRAMLHQHLALGDSRAAVVVSVAPLLIAAYSDDLDCVALLRFDDVLAREYELATGSRLLTVNTYTRQPDVRGAVIPGPGASDMWTDFWPLIADFLSDDLDPIKKRKRGIAHEEWAKTLEHGKALLAGRAHATRDGRPLHCSPADSM